MPATDLLITFPNGKEFKLPLRAVAAHRTGWFTVNDPNESWWRHEKPGVLALWPKDKMEWQYTYPHLTPEAPKDRYYYDCWVAKDFTIKLHR